MTHGPNAVHWETGKESRERMLDCFAKCCNLNHKRRALKDDENAVSSDALMVNITVCLDQLCEPFMDLNESRAGCPKSAASLHLREWALKVSERDQRACAQPTQ